MKHKNPQHKYQTCKDCGKEWNVSTGYQAPLGGYLCPYCTAKYRQLRRKNAQD